MAIKHVISSTPYKEVATPLKTFNETDVDWNPEGDYDALKTENTTFP